MGLDRKSVICPTGAISLSLRAAKQSWPQGRVDCFAALAMAV
jgi:hypothetical protein